MRAADDPCRGRGVDFRSTCGLVGHHTGHDASSPCSAQDFLDILDQQNWTLHEPVAVDPNADDCAKNPWPAAGWYTKAGSRRRRGYTPRLQRGDDPRRSRGTTR